MKISLRAKAGLLIVLITVVLGALSILLSSQVLTQIVNTTYRNRAKDVSNTMAAMLDINKAAKLRNAVMEIYNATEEKVTSEDWGSPEFDAYIARFSDIERSEEFGALRQQLRSIQDVNDVDCIYLTVVDPVNEYVIYLVDGAYEDACPPGCIDPLYEENLGLLTDPSIGFPPYITDTEPYGWLVSAGPAVYDREGNIVCYAMVDIDMETIRAQQGQYVLIHSTLLLLLTLAVCAGAIWAVNRSIVRPINLLSSAAAHYKAGNGTDNELENLSIRTRDEIQSLYRSIAQMARDNKKYIENLKVTTRELTESRIEANEMNALAYKDALTGVGSKLAYDAQVEKLTEEMRQGSARYGIVMVDMNGLKQLNDTYGHELGNEAIKRTCALICDVFKHSPVYRFGGDEFVVLVKDRDYDHIEERVREFNETARATVGEPWEKVNAAIGYALYEGEDTVVDLFRKADHRMYEQKKEMKKQKM